jgi:hypothetical protein
MFIAVGTHAYFAQNYAYCVETFGLVNYSRNCVAASSLPASASKRVSEGVRFLSDCY